jgi:GT2 family glycosyltransferase
MGVPVVVGYCSGTEIHAAFHHSVMQLVLREASTGNTHILSPGGGAFGSIGSSRIATARNGIVRTFLKSADSDWLWMIDTDMVFKPDALELLLEAADPVDRPIVGGLCFGKALDGFVYPTLYKLNDDENAFQYMHDYDRDSLVQVDATGAACLLMHRSALEKVREIYTEPMEWFQDIIWQGLDTGEDITFCLRLREVGVPVYVHTGVHIGHVKPQIVDQSVFDDMQAKWFGGEQ